MSRFTLVGLFVCSLSGALSAADPTTAPETPGSVQVVCQGKLRHGIVAIGGETTGTTLTFDGVTWELKLPEEGMRRFAEELHKQQVVVTGRLRRMEGVEIPVRWIVDVERLAMQDAKAVNDKTRVVLNGKLIPGAGQMLPQSLEVAGKEWLIAWGDDPQLVTTASALAGKQVIAQATVEAQAEAGTKSAPRFRIHQLQADRETNPAR